MRASANNLLMNRIVFTSFGPLPSLVRLANSSKKQEFSESLRGELQIENAFIQ
jgi:hypothetical protein